MSGNLVFEPLTHTYHVDGVRVPSVTECLERVGLTDFSHIPEPFRQRALDRGGRVHRAAQYLTEGLLDWTSVDETEKGYVEAAAQCLAHQEFLVLGQERRVYHPVRRYAGTIDLLGLWQDQRAIGDYCCGDLWESAKDLQTAGYAAAARLDPPEEWWEFAADAPIARVGIRLRKDGTYRIEPYTDPLDDARFAAAVVVVHEQIRRGQPGRRQKGRRAA